MEKRRKNLIKNAIIIPIIVALVISVLTVVCVANINSLSLSQNQVVLSPYEKKDIITATDDSAQTLESNTLVGEIMLDDAQLPLIYDATDVNSLGRANIVSGTAIGEIGCSYIEINKADSSKLRLVSSKDTITVQYLGMEYEFEVQETYEVAGEQELYKLGDGVSNGIVIYTDKSIGVGISHNYFACVAKMTSNV